MTDKENEIGITPSTEAVMIAKEVRAEAIQQAANSMKVIKSLLTEKQFRRVLLYYAYQYTMDQIAEMEGTSHQAVSNSICRARIKLINNYRP